MADPLSSNEYDQPEFYRFNEDSIHLAKFIQNEVNIGPLTSLCELGAGCGVISLELLQGLIFQECTLVEFQKEFIPYLEKNLQRSELLGSASIINKNVMEMEGQFDCVYFNPPYFFEERSRPSQNKQRDLCRRISKEGWQAWLTKSKSLIKKGGSLFFCHREFIEVDLKLKNKREVNGSVLHHYSA